MADRTFSTDERQTLADKGAAMPDGSFPIPDKDALRRAIASWGRGGAKASVKAFIVKRAKALSATDMLPADWPGSTQTPEKVAAAAGLEDMLTEADLAGYPIEGIPGYISASALTDEDGAFVMLSSGQTDKFVQLGRVKSGTLYKKEILVIDEPFTHPNNPKAKITIDRDKADKLLANFSAGVADIVQTPLVGDNNDHSEAPDRNIGEVIGLTIEKDSKGRDGVFATIDVRKPELADAPGKTLLGASAMLSLNYLDTKTGKQVGPTLLHTAFTNRPHITGLDDFVAASAVQSAEAPILLTGATTIDPEEDTVPQTLEQMLATLKKDHNIDVAALQAAAAKPADKTDEGTGVDATVAAVLSALGQAGVIKLSAPTDTEIKAEDVVGAIRELAEGKVELSARIKGLEDDNGALKLSRAKDEIDGLVKAGKVLPTQAAAMLELSMKDRKTFEALVPSKPIVPLDEIGLTTHDETGVANLDEEIARLSKVAKNAGMSVRVDEDLVTTAAKK